MPFLFILENLFASLPWNPALAGHAHLAFPASETNSHFFRAIFVLLLRRSRVDVYKRQEYPGHGIKLAAKLTEEKEDPAPIVAVMGGDGSLNEALNGFHMENAPILGYLPTGSGNDFARGMKLPPEPKQALDHILNPKYFYQLDYGAVLYGEENRPASRRFLVSCGMGYDAAVCHNINKTKVKNLFNALHLGKISYLLIGIKQIILCRLTDGTLKIEGGETIPLKNIAFVSCHNPVSYTHLDVYKRQSPISPMAACPI